MTVTEHHPDHISGVSSTEVVGPSLSLPLSALERLRLRRGDVTRLPLVLVIASLTLALLLPRLAQVRIDRLRDETNDIIAPAQLRIFDILLEMAVESEARRGYLISGDFELAAEIEIARAERVAAEGDIVRAARQLDRLGAVGVLAPADSLQLVDRQLDSLFAAGSGRGSPAVLEAQRERFTRVQVLAASLRLALEREAQARRHQTLMTERAAAALTAALVLLGLGAAFLVHLLGKRFRTLALRLDESDARFRQIAENLAPVIWLSDPGFTRPLYVNRAFERLSGRARESVYAAPETVWEAVHPEDRRRARLAMAESRTHPVEITLRVVRPDGTTRWLRSRTFPVRDDAGQVFRIAGIIEDITQAREQGLERERLLESERQAREAAEQGRVELERVTESRNRLLRGFTHDVKNPLGAADGYLSLIEDEVMGPLPAKVTDTVSTIRRLIGQALELVRQLLDIARAEAGQLELTFSDVDVILLLHDVAETFRPQADAKQLELLQHIPLHLPLVRSDETRVRQIVGNLVSNAIKYTQSGGQITVSSLAHGDANSRPLEVAVVVSDTGPGIETDKLPTLFAEFARFDPEAAEGAGIGLAISQKIAHALGGDITVESEPGRGSTFTLHLPIARNTNHATRPDHASHA